MQTIAGPAAPGQAAVTAVFPLARAADAHRLFEQRTAVGKLILEV
jgi:NADPH:quinone reductase-like Zn-dependent oxidoreductase